VVVAADVPGIRVTDQVPRARSKIAAGRQRCHGRGEAAHAYVLLDHYPVEAARIDGSNAWTTFRFITLPLLRPTIAVALIFRTMDSLKTFDTIYVMTEGGPNNASEILNIYVFQTGFKYFHMGYASALAVILVVFVFAVNLFLIRLRERSWSY
jgi:multiple sugar transport system permease protein